MRANAVELGEPLDETREDRVRARWRLAAAAGVSPRLAARLLRALGSPRAVLSAGPQQLGRVRGIGPARAEMIRAAPDEDDARRECERLAAVGGTHLIPGDSAWPTALDELPDPPLLLSLRGDLTAADERAVAIVGARRASRYGRATAERLARELGELGLTVVSGLARGVDAAAHAGALAAGGRTVAVLGSGLARLYPPEHLALAADIAAGRGAVVSELPLDAPPLPYHFPRRNRVIAALAVAVIVVEAGEKSGALITADHALDLGRDVLAVPGRIDAPMSVGTHRLLREGAALCAGADDVLHALGLERPEPAATTTAARGRNDEERALLAELAGEELDPDELMSRTGFSAEVALETLTALELRGAVVLLGDGRYACA